MRTIEDHLVAGVSVDRAHDTGLDRSIIVQCLSHRSEAVSGAGSSGNDLVISGQGLLVNGENDGLEIVACRSRDNYLLSACVDVSLGLVLGAVETCALENNVNADLAPRKILSVLLSVDGQGLAVNSDSTLLIISGNGVKILTDLAAVAALSGIVLEELSKHRGLGQVVDSYYIVALSAEHLSECEASDTAKAVNCNFNICHWNIPPEK